MSWGSDGGILLVCARVQQLPFVMAAITALDSAELQESPRCRGVD